MKKLSDEQKITLTLGQLKRLVESIEKNAGFITVRVDVAWDIDFEDDDEEYKKYINDNIPSTVYIKIPRKTWNDKNIDLDISGKLSDYFGYCVDDFDIHEVDPLKAPKDVLYWTSNGLEEF